MSWPDVSVVVLNYNGQQFLENCFNSLLKLDYPADRLELMCVDNHSSDGSPDLMRRTFPSVRLVETGANLVFAGGNHAGARVARGEIVVFLNNDTHVPPDWLRVLIQPLRDQPEVACTGSRIVNWDGTRLEFGGGSLNFTGFGYQEGEGLPTTLDAGTSQQPYETLFACGGAMAIRRTLFLETGGFDKDYQIYYEDTDLGWRLWLLGHRVLLVPASTVCHRQHGTMSAVSDWKRRLLFERNTIFSVVKNYEDGNLDKILPVALMLLAKRSLYMSGVDKAQYRFAPESPDAPQFGHPLEGTLRRYGRKALATFREDGISGVAAKGRRVFERLRGQAEEPSYPPKTIVRPVASDPDFEQVPRAALAYLIAADDLIRYWPRLMERRRWIQANRKRTDTEVFQMFGRALDPGFFQPEYAAAHEQLVSAFGIDRMVEGPRERSS